MPELHNYFEGWAVVELFGHGKAIGYVTTEYFGTACMFRVDTPEREKRGYALDKPTYAHFGDDMGYRTMPKGTKVERPAVPAKSRLIGPSAIFAINPCSEQLAKAQLEVDEPRPLIALEIPEKYRQKELLPGEPQPAITILDEGPDEDEEREEDDKGYDLPLTEAS